MALQGIEVEGVIIKEYPAKEGVSQRTGNAWKSQEFVIQTKDQYPRACLFRVFGADKLEQFNIHHPFAVVADSDFWFHDARQGFDSKFFLVDDAVVVDVFGKAADAVAAHFRFTAVGIDDAHADVGFIARHDDDDAVGTDARMRGAHLDGQLGKILVSAVLIFQKDEVIA